eukprot:753656-Hanusia_phi.AAC.4
MVLGRSQKLSIISSNVLEKRRDNVLLDGEHTSFIWNVTGAPGSELRICGLRFRNASHAMLLNKYVTVKAACCFFQSCFGSTLKVSDYSRLLLERCMFSKNWMLHRHLELSRDSDPLSELHGYMTGSCIRFSDKSRCRIINCTFVKNGGEHCLCGGAISVNTTHSKPIPGQLSFVDCMFRGNVARDSGGAFAMFSSSRCNITRCAFLNNTAWGVARGGGAMFLQSTEVTWVYNCSFIGNQCPEAGGALCTITYPNITEQEEDGEEEQGDTYDEDACDLLQGLDVRQGVFKDNMPYIHASFDAMRRIGPQTTIALGQMGKFLPRDLPLESDSCLDVNFTIPSELAEVGLPRPEFGRHQHEALKEQYPWTNGEIPSQDENEDCVRVQKMLSIHTMINLQYENQTFAKKYLKLRAKFGVDSVEVRSVFNEHLGYLGGILLERHFAPNGTWPKYLMPSRAESKWLQEPFYELHDWSFEDMEEFYERSRGWNNWSDVDFKQFKQWRAEREEEFKALRTKVLNEYCRRRGFKYGYADPVYLEDLENATQTWTSHKPEDFDPDINPQYPWNQPPTEEELERFGGRMRDLTPKEIEELKSRTKRPKDSDSTADNSH